MQYGERYKAAFADGCTSPTNSLLIVKTHLVFHRLVRDAFIDLKNTGFNSLFILRHMVWKRNFQEIAVMEA